MTTWGPFERSVRIGIDFHDLPAITKDTASVTVGADLRFESTQAITDNTNTTNWDWVGYGTDPDGSDTAALKLTSFVGTKYFKSVTRPVSLVYGSGQNITLNAWVNQLELVPDGQLDASATLWVPARPFQFPRPPLSVGVTKNSDTSHTVAWTGDYTAPSGGYPWAGVYVDRWDNVTNGWYRVASLGWDATSYTDTSTRADRQYRYSVYSHNATGHSTHVDTAPTYTTVAPHASVSWEKATTDVVVSWVQASTLPVATQVWEKSGTDAYTLQATVAAGTNTWTHIAPNPAVTHRYAVLPVLTGAPSTVYTYSTTVQLLAAPLAPTSLAPDGATVDSVASPVVLAWQHNPVDGTGQTAYEVQHRVDGGSWVSSGKVTSSGSRTVAAGTWPHGKAIDWQVRTYGQHASASPWSSIASFTTGAKPAVTIQSPPATYGRSDLVVSWTFYDAEGTGQTSATVELLDASDAQLYAHTVTGTGVVHAVGYALANLTSYKVRVTARDGSGLWSAPATFAFSTEFVPPPAALVTTTWDRNLGTVDIGIDNANAVPPAESVAAVSNRIWRSIDGGAFELVADNLPLDTTVTDWTPASKGTNAYRVETVSATPTSAFSALSTVEASSPWVFVNGGPNGSIMARLKGGPSVGMTSGREKVLHQFAGRRAPVEFVGAARVRQFKVSGSVDGHGLTAMGDWQAWELVADLPAPLLYRDPMGRRVLVSISDVEVQHEAPSKYAKVSATLTEVDR